MSGTKSPINPWTDKDTFEPNFNLLNESKLEKCVFFYLNIVKNFDIITLGIRSKFGKIFNVLEKVIPDDANKLPYFSPSDKDKNIIEISAFFELSL